MKKTTLAAFVVTIFAAVSTGALATGMSPLADRHAQFGVKCEQCHGTAAPVESKVKNDACFACHSNYDTLAKRTEKLEPNPHRTHLGNVRCSDCHSGHGEARLMCNDCHKFDLRVK